MRSYTLTSTRKPAGKALARHSRCALVSELLKDQANTKYLLRHRNFAEKGTGTDVFRSKKFHPQEPVCVRLEKLHMEWFA